MESWETGRSLRSRLQRVEYAGFEGTMPEGRYDAGAVEIWDKGEYILGDKEENELIIQIKSSRLEGVAA